MYFCNVACKKDFHWGVSSFMKKSLPRDIKDHYCKGVYQRVYYYCI